MISKDHNNRRLFNWLIYDTSDRLLESLSEFYQGTIYDLGAGDAPYRDFFLGYAESYVAVDWSGSAHETELDIEADLNSNLPIESGVADTVVSLSVLEHLNKPQMMLDEACRILRPGGTIVLQVPFQWQVHESPHDYFRYTTFGLDYLFEQAGFVDIRIIPQAGVYTTLALKFNYASIRLIPKWRPLRTLTYAILIPIWYLGQKLAPLLDKLDKDWAREAPGYFVTARKP